MENNWSGKNALVIIYGYGKIPNEKRKERYVSASGLRRCMHDDNEGLAAEVCRRRQVKPSKTRPQTGFLSGSKCSGREEPPWRYMNTP